MVNQKTGAYLFSFGSSKYLKLRAVKIFEITITSSYLFTPLNPFSSGAKCRTYLAKRTMDRDTSLCFNSPVLSLHKRLNRHFVVDDHALIILEILLVLMHASIQHETYYGDLFNELSWWRTFNLRRDVGTLFRCLSNDELNISLTFKWIKGTSSLLSELWSCVGAGVLQDNLILSTEFVM